MTHSILRIKAPLDDQTVSEMTSGMRVFLSGKILTARDAAHSRLADMLFKGLSLPFDIRGQVIYYAAPAPTPPGQIIGPIGPTTSTRMDPYTPTLIEAGLKGMIGKGLRSESVVESIKKNKAVYLGATGGAAVLLGRSVRASRLIAFPELGPEAICELEVEDMPLVVIIDSTGENLYLNGPSQWAAKK